MRDALHHIIGGKKKLLPISTDTFIWALQCACQVHHVPFAAEMALRQFPPPYNSATLQHAMHEMGFKGRWRKVQEADLEHLVFPCFAAMNPAIEQEPKEQGASAGETPHGLALLAKLEMEKRCCSSRVISNRSLYR